MSDIIVENSNDVLIIQLSRPSRKNALTSSLCIALAEVLCDAGKDDCIHVVLLHGAGESFCAGNDVEDFFENPPNRSNFPESNLMKTLFEFNKPIVAAVRGEVVGAGIALLTQCDSVYATESTKFQIAFLNLALIPKLRAGWSIPNRLGRLEVAGLQLLGPSFDAQHAIGIGLVTRLVSDQELLFLANETARELADDPAIAMYGRQRLARHPFRDQIDVAIKVRSEHPIRRVRYEGTSNTVVPLFERLRVGASEMNNVPAAA